MVCDQARVIARQAIHRPIRRHDVRVVIAATDRFSFALLPTGPGGPVERRVVLKSRHVRRRVIEQTLAHAVLVRAVAVLQTAPQDLVDELLILFNLLFSRLAKLLHRRRQPGTRAAFVS